MSAPTRRGILAALPVAAVLSPATGHVSARSGEHPDAGLLARCDSARAALRRWEAASAYDDSGLSRAEIGACEDASDAACVAFHDAMEAVAATPGLTLAGLAEKARLLRMRGLAIAGPFGFQIGDVFEADAARDLAWSLIQDVERLATGGQA